MKQTIIKAIMVCTLITMAIIGSIATCSAQRKLVEIDSGTVVKDAIKLINKAYDKRIVISSSRINFYRHVDKIKCYCTAEETLKRVFPFGVNIRPHHENFIVLSVEKLKD